jgi:hypothetical protein
MDEQEIGVRFQTVGRGMSQHSVYITDLGPIQWVPETFSPGLMGSGREAVHSSLSSAEAKNLWKFPFTPSIPPKNPCHIASG